MIWLAIAAIAFVGSHFLLSHPLRQPLVRAVGDGPFRGIYALVALVTFGAMIWIYHRLAGRFRCGRPVTQSGSSPAC